MKVSENLIWLILRYLGQVPKVAPRPSRWSWRNPLLKMRGGILSKPIGFKGKTFTLLTVYEQRIEILQIKTSASDQCFCRVAIKAHDINCSSQFQTHTASHPRCKSSWKSRSQGGSFTGSCLAPRLQLGFRMEISDPSPTHLKSGLGADFRFQGGSFYKSCFKCLRKKIYGVIFFWPTPKPPKKWVGSKLQIPGWVLLQKLL